LITIQKLHFGVKSKRIESRVLTRFLYTHVLCSIIHNNQKVVTPQLFMSE
jgi:hypothetical protein